MGASSPRRGRSGREKQPQHSARLKEGISAPRVPEDGIGEVGDGGRASWVALVDAGS